MELTAETILNKLATDMSWLEQAVLAIHRRQTSDEQAAMATHHLNGRGFNSADARPGTYMANWLRRGNHLSGKWVEKARKIMPKYVGQLLEAAKLKAAEKAEQARLKRQFEAEKSLYQLEAVGS